MEEKTSNGLRQQQARRKRINRMKTFLVAGFAIWILALSVLMVTVFFKVSSLEERLDKELVSKEEVIQQDDEKSADSPKDNAAGAVVRDDSQAEDGSAGNGPADESLADGTLADGLQPVQEEGLEQEDVPEEEVMDDTNSLDEGEHPKVYLTFDDGPSENTSKILDILKERGIKATFFVIGQEDEASKELYQRIVPEGHTLGMHSFSHKYDVIYKSLESFQEDMEHLRSYLEDVTGVTPTIMRFPGGSSNQVSNVDIRELIHYVKEQGITYYDWNVVSGDATSQVYTPDELVANVMEDVVKYDTSVVLMHDSSPKATTVDALGPMIDQLQELGAEILPIDETTKPIQHIDAEDVE